MQEKRERREDFLCLDDGRRRGQSGAGGFQGASGAPQIHDPDVPETSSRWLGRR